MALRRSLSSWCNSSPCCYLMGGTHLLLSLKQSGRLAISETSLLDGGIRSDHQTLHFGPGRRKMAREFYKVAIQTRDALLRQIITDL